MKLPKPLFEDPVYGSPTDPVIVWNHLENMWYLFYTQRRATEISVGVSWVHGTKIGVAVSKDGATWLYRGTLEGLEFEHGTNTFWAPEIIFAEGEFHMFVSYVQGIPVNWNYGRKMIHYVSDNIWDWTFKGEIDLKSDRVIDACVYKIDATTYKMWFKDERDHSHTAVAVSKDLYNWEVLGPEITDMSQEGPNVFMLNGHIYMVSDYWHGLAVYKSNDFKTWERCSDVLNDAGLHVTDAGIGHHADVLEKDGRAFIVYFTTPDLDAHREGLLNSQLYKAYVQIAELKEKDGYLVCDRNADVEW